MKKTSSPKRSYSVTITLVGVFGFGIWNIGRVIALYQQTPYLLSLDIKPDPRLRLIVALIWALLFGGMTIALWLKRPFTRWAIPLTLSCYAVYEIILRALFVQVPSSRLSWLGQITFYLLIILFTYWALNRPTMQPNIKEEIS